MKSFLKYLASLQLAVLVLIALSVVTAVGTIIESRYNAEVASQLVYRTYWTYSVLGLLAINLASVMIDRWPWRRRHVPFLLAHTGILILLLGSAITFFWGIDGNMRVPIGSKNDSAVINDMVVSVWGSFDGERFSPLIQQPVNFFLQPPQKKPVELTLPEESLRIIDYHPFAIPSRKVIASDNPKVGGAVRFQMQNAMTHSADWIVQRRSGDVVTHQLGPAAIILGPLEKNLPKENRIYLSPTGEKLRYVITYKDDHRPNKTGWIKEAESLQTGWMGFEFKILRWMPYAQDTWEYEPQERPTQVTMSAVQVAYRGNHYWLGEDEVIKLFSHNAVYFVRYGHRTIPLGFDLQLKNFIIDRYQGTMRAAAYKSEVEVAGQTHTISMNEPLKHSGYTIYQASFQEDPPGRPVASIFSVNYDPGRWIKYLGSLLLSLGIVWLFYDKRKASRAMAPQGATPGREETW